jgi:hypothetical protein
MHAFGWNASTTISKMDMKKKRVRKRTFWGKKRVKTGNRCKHLFPPLIANNFYLAEWIQAFRDKRDAIQVEATVAQALTEETLLAPEHHHHIYLLRAKVQTTTDSNKLRAAYHALTEVERDLQDSLITRQKKVHENNSAHFDGLYLAGGP